MDFNEWGIQHLVQFFDLTEKQIKYFAFNKGSRKLYSMFKIPKRSWWYRVLRAPCQPLKIIQKKILDEILYNYDVLLSDMTTGFRENKSIVDNALMHRNKEFILKIDIQDFFPSISRDRIFWLFYRTFDFSYEIANLFAWICSYRNELPQGAPTSPMIANLIARSIDYRIIWLLKKLNDLNSTNDLSYSRYADDITISFSWYMNIVKLTSILDEILNEEGFILNPRKIRLISSNFNQTVTGITVNKKISLWKHIHKQWRAIIYTIWNKWWDAWLERWNYVNWLNLDLIEFKNMVNWYKNYFSMLLNQSEQESLTLKSLVKNLNTLQF